LRIGRHEAHVWPSHRLADRLRVERIILVGLGSFFVHITSSSDDLLVKANEAIDSAEKFRTHAETVQDDLDYFREVSEGLRSLYIIYSTARGLLERAVTDRVTDEEKLIQELLSQTKTDLLLSLGFERNHTWTICVYRGLRDDSDGYYYLSVVADERSIPCERNNARRWREGIGVGGMAFAKINEVVAPDILDEAAISLFALSDSVMKPDDLDRYRSMFAVPISVNSSTRPWGVVLASCNERYHFEPNEDPHTNASNTLSVKEPIRAIAGLVAFAVAICRANDRLGISEARDERQGANDGTQTNQDGDRSPA